MSKRKRPKPAASKPAPSSSRSDATEPRGQAGAIIPLTPRPGLFKILLALTLAWLVAMLALYWTTVRPMRVKDAADPVPVPPPPQSVPGTQAAPV